MLVFTRIGGMVMLMPGFGEVSVPPWIRLGMAFAITMVMFPLVSDVLPAMPDSSVGYAAAVTTEALVGLFIGGIARLLLTALHVGGLAIAMQTGLGFAQGFDPTQQSQSAMVGTFLTLVGVNLILATNLHHLMIGAMHDSYQIFMPGDLPPVADFAQIAVTTISKSFALGIQIAAPFIVFGIVFYVGIGLLARLMPQVQIFFIAVPAQIMFGLLILGLVLPSFMLWFLDYFETGMNAFLVGP